MLNVLVSIGLILIGYGIGRAQREDRKLMVQLNLDCTQAVSIKAHSVDAEGNAFVVDPALIAVSIVNPVGDFGSLTDASTFSPGAMGASGEIHLKATVDGTELETAVAITLVHGAPTELIAEFAPVVAASPVVPESLAA